MCSMKEKGLYFIGSSHKENYGEIEKQFPRELIALLIDMNTKGIHMENGLIITPIAIKYFLYYNSLAMDIRYLNFISKAQKYKLPNSLNRLKENIIQGRFPHFFETLIAMIYTLEEKDCMLWLITKSSITITDQRFDVNQQQNLIASLKQCIASIFNLELIVNSTQNIDDIIASMFILVSHDSPKKYFISENGLLIE